MADSSTCGLCVICGHIVIIACRHGSHQRLQSFGIPPACHGSSPFLLKQDSKRRQLCAILLTELLSETDLVTGSSQLRYLVCCRRLWRVHGPVQGLCLRMGRPNCQKLKLREVRKHQKGQQKPEEHTCLAQVLLLSAGCVLFKSYRADAAGMQASKTHDWRLPGVPRDPLRKSGTWCRRIVESQHSFVGSRRHAV